MNLGLDFWARFLAGIIRRESRRMPLGESRLDKEARRWSDGCLLVVLVLVILLGVALWKADLLFQ